MKWDEVLGLEELEELSKRVQLTQLTKKKKCKKESKRRVFFSRYLFLPL